jgi:hypothetical protein
MRRTDARIHVEQDASRRSAAVDAIDPSARKLGERREVLLGDAPLSNPPASISEAG